MRQAGNPTSVPPTLGANITTPLIKSAVQPSTSYPMRSPPFSLHQNQPSKLSSAHEAVYDLLARFGISNAPVTCQSIVNSLTEQQLADIIQTFASSIARPITPQCAISMDHEYGGSLFKDLLTSQVPYNKAAIQNLVRVNDEATAANLGRPVGQAYTPQGQDKGRRVHHPGPTRGGYPDSRAVSPSIITKGHARDLACPRFPSSLAGPEEAWPLLDRPHGKRETLAESELISLCLEGRSPTYDPSVKFDTPTKDVYSTDDDPGYRCLRPKPPDSDRQYFEPLYDFEQVLAMKNRKAVQMAHKMINDRDYVSKPSPGGRGTASSQHAQIRSSHAVSGSMDDELMAAASPVQTGGSVTPQLPGSGARFASSLNATDLATTKRDQDPIWQATESAQPASNRDSSPVFGGRADDDTPDNNSPMSGASLHSMARVHNDFDEPQSPTVEILGITINRLQARQDAILWRTTYSEGKHSAHREQRRQYRDADPRHRYLHLKPDHELRTTISKPQLDCFCLKIIYEQDRTGFQEDETFKDDLGTYVAGRYKIIQHLGSAAFSKVYKCFDEHEKRGVCLKMIDAKTPETKKDYMDQSLDEIQLLRYIQANSPDNDPSNMYCVDVFDWFYFKEHLFIVTELLGDNLYAFDQRMLKLCPERRYFTLGRIQKIAYQILVSLSFIHPLRLIHCDLKPENILMFDEREPLVKVIDFGSSCFEDDKISVYVQSRSYRAPEVLLGLAYDQKIDLWSLGCILAELWTGYVLFQNRDVQSMLARIAGILGPLPYYMVAASPLAKKYFTDDGQLQRQVPWDPRVDFSPERVVWEAMYPKRSSLKQRMRTTDHEFLDFLAKLLCIDPCKRLDSRQALKHPFLAPGRYEDGLLPQT